MLEQKCSLLLLVLSLCKSRTGKKTSSGDLTVAHSVQNTYLGAGKKLCAFQMVYAFNFKQSRIKINLAVEIRNQYSRHSMSH